MLFYKAVLFGILCVGYFVGSTYFLNQSVEQEQSLAMRQLENNDQVPAEIRENHLRKTTVLAAASVLLVAAGLALFSSDARKWLASLGVFALLMFGGCIKPFEPVMLETIKPNEEAFLLPYTGDVKKQTSTNSEEYLKENLVYTKQVKIPQQWVQTGYEVIGYNGNWQPAAVLVKVDKSPVTREWTADPNSGTSNRNEAIWVMTSDQVEFSTGWTCTARISTRDDAVKFLHNYPNGALQQVMDSEVRAKIQTIFGLEVTDLPMEKLRKEATPHIQTVVKETSAFFKERGITITNLGISGGFVYKDKTIMDTMVKVFNAEQEKSIATAEYSAQEERNKMLLASATNKADALLKEKKAEGEGIKAVADAKSYEIEKAKQDSEMYLALKHLEIEKEKLTRWDGHFPTYYMGSGKDGPELLLSVPPPPVMPVKTAVSK